MYKKALGVLALANCVIFAGLFCVTGVKVNRIAAVPAFRMKLDASYTADERYSAIGMTDAASSDQRVVDYGVLEQEAAEPEADTLQEMDAEAGVSGAVRAAAPEENMEQAALSAQPEDTPAYLLEEEDYDLLLRIVEAEAGSEDEDGRLLVANVVLNRVNSSRFPDTVSEVILQESNGVHQFSPVGSGRIWKVDVTEETVAAVGRALEGEDISQGALFFAARKHADSDSMRWFDEKLTFLFSHGGHEFFS